MTKNQSLSQRNPANGPGPARLSVCVESDAFHLLKGIGSFLDNIEKLFIEPRDQLLGVVSQMNQGWPVRELILYLQQRAISRDEILRLRLTEPEEVDKILDENK